MRRLLLVALALIIGSSQPSDGRTTPDPAPTPSATHCQANDGQASDSLPRRIDSKHLPNLVQVHAKVFSGGLPAGDHAFQELRSLGVKTVISVDGAAPDAPTARKHGLRYVHLPHGYDGVPDQRVKQLAKAVRQLEGPLYIHCHHGKHRSPAAASAACVAAGLIPESLSVSILKIAGTSPHYRGLYESARRAVPLETALLDQLTVEFPEKAELPPMAEAMVAIAHTHGHLQLVAAAGWRSPPDHPDLDPAHEALLLREHFTEMLRTDQTQQHPPAFQELLRHSEQASHALEQALRHRTTAQQETTPPESVQHLWSRINNNCNACHQQFRDVPLSEK